MTPPVLTSVPPTVHRRRNPGRPQHQHRTLAEQVAAALASHQPTVVQVDGCGRGWWVTEVGDGTYTVWRDGATMTVPWTDVTVGR